jgi:hypothetical protein
MAALHVLEGDGIRYRVVAHTATPAGNNTAGNSWKNCLLSAGLNTTTLAEGVGVGQITAAEKAQVVAGDVIEMVFTIDVPTVGTNGNKLVAVQNAVAKMQADYLAQLQERFRYFGYTNG